MIRKWTIDVKHTSQHTLVHLYNFLENDQGL